MTNISSNSFPSSNPQNAAKLTVCLLLPLCLPSPVRAGAFGYAGLLPPIPPDTFNHQLIPRPYTKCPYKPHSGGSSA